jgi:hypothetical protein
VKNVSLTGLFNLQAAASGRRKFSIVAYDGGKMSVAGFPAQVVLDLATCDLSTATSLPLLLDHSPKVEDTLGVIRDVQCDGTQLSVSGEITGTSERCLTVLAQADKGHQWQASVTSMANQMREVGYGETVNVNGRSQVGPFVLLTGGILREVSIVGLGASPGTSVNLSAMAAAQYPLKGNEMDFESWLKGLGVDMATLSDEGKAFLMSVYEKESGAAETVQAENAPMTETKPADVQASAGVPGFMAGRHKVVGRDTPASDPVGEMIARQNRAAAANATRVAEVSRLTRDHADLQASAIADNWSVEKTELEVLRRQRGQAPSNVISQNVLDDVMLEAAVARAAGLKDLNASYGEQVVEKAAKVHRNGVTLQQAIVLAARRNGWNGLFFSDDPKGCFREAFKDVSAAFGGLSLPNIFANVANKSVLVGYESVEDSWRQIANIGSVIDFKTNTRNRMFADATFEKIGAGGEIKFGTLGEETFTIKADTYAKMYAITRQDIINDDLDVLSGIPRQLGRGAALKINDVFWTVFGADHGTFFTTTRKNYFEGSTTNLQVSSLTTAEQMFLDQVDPTGAPLGIQPSILLVPNALLVTGTSLFRDLEVRDNTASKQYTTGNPHAGKFTVVPSSYLGNASYGNSSTAWYLLANPNDMAMMDVVFLNGAQQPVIEQAEADFNTLGIQMRGYGDFGVAKRDYRGVVKSKGAA